MVCTLPQEWRGGSGIKILEENQLGGSENFDFEGRALLWEVSFTRVGGQRIFGENIQYALKGSI